MDHPEWRGDERDFFEAVKEEVKRKLPKAFGHNPRRGEASGVEGNELVGGRGNTGKKTFADLPEEAKAECMKMKRAGMKPSDFVAEYFGTDAITFGD